MTNKFTMSLVVFLASASVVLGQTNTFPSSGNVGIGTLSPNAKLQVIGQDISFLSNTSNNRFSFGRKNREKFEIYVDDYNGFLDYKQDVDRNEAHIFYIRNLAEGTNQHNGIRFQTAGADRFTIKRNGNVGIGTSDPASKLTVAGRLRISTPNAPVLQLREESTGQDALVKVGRSGFAIDVEKVSNAFFIQKYGNVGIGTTTPDAKLTVAGNIHAREVRVTTDAGADFVFEDDYALRSLSELDAFVQENKHLPEIAPAAQMVEEGVSTGEFQIQLLQKIEELTLYVIEQDKKMNEQKQKMEAQQIKIKRLESKINNQ